MAMVNSEDALAHGHYPRQLLRLDAGQYSDKLLPLSLAKHIETVKGESAIRFPTPNGFNAKVKIRITRFEY
jgi:hypothetical protein